MGKYTSDLAVVILNRLQLRNGDRVNVVFTSSARYHLLCWGSSSRLVYSIPEWVNLKRCCVVDHLVYIKQRDVVMEGYIAKGYVHINESDLRTWEFWSGMWNIGR